MASTTAVRRALTRLDIEGLVQGVHAERPLPPAYLVLDDVLDNYSVAYLLRVRANGFMVAVPDLQQIRSYVEAVVNDEGEPLALTQPEQAQAETVRGRHLGPARVLLVDLPWSGAEHFVKTQALRGIPDRASRVTALTVGSQPGRPMAGDLIDAASRWVEHLDPDTAQEYWASAAEGPEQEADEEEMPEQGVQEPAALTTPTPFRPLPPEARASTGTGSDARSTFWSESRAFGDAAGTTSHSRGANTDEDRGRGTPGGADHSAFGIRAFGRGRVGGIASCRCSGPGEEKLMTGSTLQALLLAQMRQNAVLLERLAAGTKSGDGVQDALSAGGGNGSDSSGGIKGHLAREAFVKQVSDLKMVASRVQSQALAELGLSQAEPGMMRDYIEKRVPLQDQRLLQNFAALAAHGWEQGFRSGNQELQGFTSRLLMFVEQAALDNGKTQLGYLLSGYPDPAPLGFSARRAPGLKTFSRLTPPQWMAANLAYLKDLDYARLE